MLELSSWSDLSDCTSGFGKFHQYYFYTIFDVIPDICKWDYLPCDDLIIMTDSSSVAVDGTARIHFCTAGSKTFYTVPVYILKNTSHPFILDSNYMKDSGIVLDSARPVTLQ